MKSKKERYKNLDQVYFLINKIRAEEYPTKWHLDRISDVIAETIGDDELNSKGYLLWAIGYLHGLSSASKPIKEQLIVIKEYLHDLDNERFPLKDQNGNDDDFTTYKYKKEQSDNLNNTSYGNDEHYNENLDLDQQHPDFYT
jgi:hypothetical protein